MSEADWGTVVWMAWVGLICFGLFVLMIWHEEGSYC